MQPVITPEQMRLIDGAASEPVDLLIERAGWMVAKAAREMLGGTYGRRIAVLAGKGNNGADGLAAARVLEAWGARCVVHRADELPRSIPGCGSTTTARRAVDLVIDACFGTGFRGEFLAPEVGQTPVLAVDIPSGVDGLTGAVSGRPLHARRTVTFVAAKPGLLLWPGRAFIGELSVADIGLPSSAPGEETSRFWLDGADVASWPVRPSTAHKWNAAVWIIGGSPGMNGAPNLAALGALRAGAGHVRLSIPGAPAGFGTSVTEAVEHPLADDWANEVLGGADRFGALVIGPGLALDEHTLGQAAHVIERWPGRLVVDAGALGAPSLKGSAAALRRRSSAAVLTPHDGEFLRLGGNLSDRLTGVESLAAQLGSVVLLKGPTTLVAEPTGRTWFCTQGDERLASAGTGDVLAGVIGAALALGAEPGRAAALGAVVHGRAAGNGHRIGFMAGDLPALIAGLLSAVPIPLQ